MVNQDDNTSKRSQDKHKRTNAKHWDSLPWMDNVYRDNSCKIQHNCRKVIGNYSILVTETLAIVQAILDSIQKGNPM